MSMSCADRRVSRIADAVSKPFLSEIPAERILGLIWA